VSKRVVAGGPIQFRDDLPIVEAAIAEPLGLRAAGAAIDELLPQVFSVWFKRRYFELASSGAASASARARIWDREYALVERPSALAREQAFLRAHAAAIAGAQRAWLGRVLGGADPAALGAQAAALIAEKIAALCQLRTRPPQLEVGKGELLRAQEESALAALQGHERLLLVDGKVYELLSLAEYLRRFERAFDAGLLRELEQACETATPAEICRRMGASLDRLDKRTYGVIRGKVHFDRRTFELELDGVYFIPEYLARRGELLSWYEAAIERALKLEALNQLQEES
jgi:hypothetical protein